MGPSEILLGSFINEGGPLGCYNLLEGDAEEQTHL